MEAVAGYTDFRETAFLSVIKRFLQEPVMSGENNKWWRWRQSEELKS